MVEPAAKKANIVLVGMPGAGKSTLGVILAKALGWKFVDTDLAIQEREGRLLQEILDTDGPNAFRRIEEAVVLSLACRNTVIATGGSVVYSEKAMAHLSKDGVVIYLPITFAEMERRLINITTRGIVLVNGENLRAMYDERVPLYERYADIVVGCEGGHFEECVATALCELERFRG
jgi:shikimate kinase